MHELGIVFHIIRTVEDVARQNDVTRIRRVTLQLGEVSGVVESYLQDCWKWAAAKSELLPGAVLTVETIPAVTVCEDCGQQYPTVQFGRTCPHCGRPMSMNLRADDTFVEDVGWHTAADRYSEFLRRHEGQHILFLELGVGYNTPVIIKYPFWRMTAKNPNAFYVCINQGQAICPPEIERQSVCIHADIGAIIAQL